MRVTKVWDIRKRKGEWIKADLWNKIDKRKEIEKRLNQAKSQ